MSDTSQGEGWWLASDGRWYPPADGVAPLQGEPVAATDPAVSQETGGLTKTEQRRAEYEEKKQQRKAAYAEKKEARQEKLQERKDARPEKAMLARSEYLGGLPGTKKASGNLIFDTVAVGVGPLHPKKGVVAWSDMAGISFDSATMKKSRAGKAVMFGVLALAAKSTQNAAEITIQLKDSNVALYTVAGMTGAQVRAKVQPFLMSNGVPCLDDAPLSTEAPSLAPAPPTPLSTADEIAKLVALRDSGAITDEEFTAYKANLMS